MLSSVTHIGEAEEFLKNLKRSDNWVSDEALRERLENSLDLARKHGREDLFPYAGVNLCLFFLDTGDYGKAWDYATLAREYADKQENFEKLLDAISLQSRTQRFLGNLEKAQELINDQIDVAIRFKDPHQIASAYHNQGTLFHRQRLRSEAMDAFQRSLEYIIKSKHNYYIAYFHLGYGAVLLDFGELDLAEKILKKGFDIAKKNQFLLPLALGYSNYGLLYQMQKKEAACFKAYKECIRIFLGLKNYNDMNSAKIMLAEAYLSFNQLNEAEKQIKETIEFTEKNDLKYNLTGLYETLSSLYEKQGKYKESLDILRKLIKVKEAYLNAESDKRIRNMEMQQKVNILQLEKSNAEKLAHIKHDFLANMSHEIRTPINSILGICYLLEQRALGPVESDYIHRLQRSGENLLGIVNDVLDISKIESGKMDLAQEPFSLDEVVNDVYQVLEHKARDKQIDFRVLKKPEPLPNIRGDRLRLYQVLLNLVSNAIKFTQEGRVTLKTTVSPGKSKLLNVTFEIKDTGIGIAKAKLDRIFERYEQADAGIKNTFGGTGLGLSISKKLIELMNGQLEVKSRLNRGTTFTLGIPFPAAESIELPVAEMKLDPAKLDGKTILIADDSEENRLVAKEILLNFNPSIKILEAENGQQVLDQLITITPDIIFMDLDMPVLNGIETVHAIRKKTNQKTIRIIANTASLLSIDEEDLIKFGFNKLVFKPYNNYQLLKLMLEIGENQTENLGNKN